MDVSPAKRSYFTCANVWWKLLFHSTTFCELLIEKVNATLRSFGDADKILDQLKVRRFICILTKNASVL